MKKLNKKNIVTIITLILMIAIEACFLVLLNKQLQGEHYLYAGIEFKKILTTEIIITEMLIIILMSTFKFKHYKLNNYLCGIFLLLNFFLIAYKFHSYGNFINTCLLFVYTLYVKKISSKK